MAATREALELDALVRGKAPQDARPLVVAFINERLAPKQCGVLVGGGAVELYTAGGYTTGDVDLIGDRAAIGRVLESAGFVRDGRAWRRDDLGLVVEVPGAFLRETETVDEVEVGDRVVPVVSVEDVIVDRLCAAKFWGSRRDWDQAQLVLAIQRERIRDDELRKKARGNDVEDALDKLLEETPV